MGRHAPAAGVPACGGREDAGRVCPACGSGELFLIELARPGGVAGRAAYCAGVYDRRRHRFVRRSCGYCGSAPEASETSPWNDGGPPHARTAGPS